MANKINNLLSKSGWSGEEVGRAAVKHVIEEYISFKDPRDRDWQNYIHSPACRSLRGIHRKQLYLQDQAS